MNNETKTTNQQGPDAPQASENKPEVEKLPATVEGEKPEKMDVDSTGDAKETKPDVATGTESKSDTNDGADGKVTSTEEKKNDRPRFNGAGRKRYKWLIDNGYDPDDAVIWAKDPAKVKELREKADQKKDFNFEEERKTLGSAAKKRLNWLLKNGHTEQEAIKLARLPPSSLKRTNGNPAGGPPNKVAKLGTPTGPILMAVAAKDYPSTYLKKDQANKLKAAILQQVVERKVPELKPQFSSCTFVQGYLRVECSDQATRQWLQKIVPKLELWEGASIKIMSEKNLLKFDKFVAYFPESRKDSDKDILGFIECQNEDLDTSKWNVHGRREAGNKVELVFSMDAASAKLVEKLDNEVNYKFNKVKIGKVKASGSAPTTAGNRQVPSTNIQMRPPIRAPLPAEPLTSLLSSLVPIWDIALPKVANFPQVVNPVERNSNVFLQAITSAGRNINDLPQAINPVRTINYDQQRSNRRGNSDLPPMNNPVGRNNNDQKRNNRRGAGDIPPGITPVGRANNDQQRSNRRGNGDVPRTVNPVGRSSNDQQRSNLRGDMFNREQRSGGRSQANTNSRSLVEELHDQQGGNRGGNQFDRDRSGGRIQMDSNSGSLGDDFYNQRSNDDGGDLFDRNRFSGGSSNRNSGNNQNDNGPRKRTNNRSSGGNQSNSNSCSLVDNLYDQLRNATISSGNTRSMDQFESRRGNNYSSGGGNSSMDQFESRRGNNYSSGGGGNSSSFNDTGLQRSNNFSSSSGTGGGGGYGSFSSSFSQLDRNPGSSSYSSSSYGRLSLGRRSFFGF